jgi:hypothetical protein
MMKRSDFLRGLLAHGALLGLPRLEPPPDLTTGPVLLRVSLRGHRYHDGPLVLDRLHRGEPVHLVREPGNEFDEHAVAVHWNGAHLGYIPREHNRVLATLLDQGVALGASLVKVRDREHGAPCQVEVCLVA